MSPELELILSAVFYGLVIPAAVTAGVLFVMLPWGKLPHNVATLAVPALAATVGFLAGYGALTYAGALGNEWLVPTGSWQWLPLLSVVAVVSGGIERLPRLPEAIRWLPRMVIAVLTGWLVVRGEAAIQPVNPGWYVGLGLAVVALWASLDLLVQQWPGPALSSLLALVGLAAALVLELTANMRLAQIGAVAAAVLAGTACLGWWYPREPLARGAIPGLAVLLPGLLFVAHYNNYGGVPAASLLLVLTSPLLLAAGALSPVPNVHARRQQLIAGLAMLVPLIVALTLAVAATAES